MFRIKQVMENKQMIVWKAEGEIGDADFDAWAESLVGFPDDKGRQHIIDFCAVSFISAKAAGYLVNQVTANVFILNAPAAIENMICSSGFSKQVLG